MSLEKQLSVFSENGSVESAVEALVFCLENKLFSIGSVLSELFEKLFPHNSQIKIASAKLAKNKGEFNICFETLEKLKTYNLSETQLEEFLKLQCECIPSLSGTFIKYNSDIVTPKKSDNPLITFTITTCKRYDLFEKTMNSFLACCKDLHLIDEWLCVDDNSSAEDREKMKTNYPFFTFYFKTVEEKGHPRSMNIIHRTVKTPYIFHMEDDWEFFYPSNYITQCLEILSQKSDIGQCLLNRNYAEIARDVDIIGGKICRTESGLVYSLHEHCATHEEYIAFFTKYGKNKNCAYWPHFSFRPSLHKKEIWNKVGFFDEKQGHFEMEYSHRYAKEGYSSAFLQGIYSLHTGRLTSERNDPTKQNAYTLNNEKQFVPKETSKTYVVNLDRRPDRWTAFTKKTEGGEEDGKYKFLNYSRFSAVDGQKLTPNDQLQRIFENNDYMMRQGMVGCALSHISIWIELVYSPFEYFCVLEDDIDFVPEFQKKFTHLVNSLPTDWDICFLGHHIWKQYRTDADYDKEALPVHEKWNSEKSLKLSMGGTGGYLISKKGALAMLEFINSRGMTNGIDTIMQKSADTLNVYYSSPHLIYSECWTPENSTDTDIQHNFTTLDLGRQGNTELYPERLKIQNKYDISDAIGKSAKNGLRMAFISCSETTHLSEAIEHITGQKNLFPFDKTDGGRWEDFAEIIIKVLETDNIPEFVKTFCRSNKYGIIFPHEDGNRLEEIYTEKFTRLVATIKSDVSLVFIHCSRWLTSSIVSFENFLTDIKKYNKNVLVFTINGIEESQTRVGPLHVKNLMRTYLPFDPVHRVSDWPQEKIAYDQSQFRPKVKTILENSLFKIFSVKK